MSDSEDLVRKAMSRAFGLGQTYLQQADSEYTSQHRKADETREKFSNLIEETIAALRERLAQPEQSPLDRMAENARELGLDYEPVEHTKKYVAEQEPVAGWTGPYPEEQAHYEAGYDAGFADGVKSMKKPTIPGPKPPQCREWQGLTEEEVDNCTKVSDSTASTYNWFARAIEAKLKEKNA